MVGLMSINGTLDSGPTRLGNPIVDIATGLFSTIAILMGASLVRVHAVRPAVEAALIADAALAAGE